jgi:Protein of unknown function (DUF2752)
MSPGSRPGPYDAHAGSRPWIAQICVPLLSATILTGCILLHFYPPASLHLPPCVFHQLTGFYCPGCGAARALHHLMNLEFSAAARCNLLFVAALPFFLYVFVIEGLRVLSVWRAPKPKLSPNASWALIAIVIAWWVIRNLPFACFAIPS